MHPELTKLGGEYHHFGVDYDFPFESGVEIDLFDIAENGLHISYHIIKIEIVATHIQIKKVKISFDRKRKGQNQTAHGAQVNTLRFQKIIV